MKNTENSHPDPSNQNELKKTEDETSASTTGSEPSVRKTAKKRKKTEKKSKGALALAWFKALNTTARTLVIAAIVVLAVILMMGIGQGVQSIFNNQEGKVTVQVKSILSKVENVSDLTGLSYMYNSVTKVTDENDPSRIRYYVRYDGNVQLTIDFSEIEVTENPQNRNVIDVILPPIKAVPTVDPESLSFIDREGPTDEEQIVLEAMQACQADLKEKGEHDQSLLDIGKENIENIIDGLTKPFIPEGTEVNYLWKDELNQESSQNSSMTSSQDSTQKNSQSISQTGSTQSSTAGSQSKVNSTEAQAASEDSAASLAS